MCFSSSPGLLVPHLLCASVVAPGCWFPRFNKISDADTDVYELNLLSCCSEYLAIFKKTVAMHEVFLQRLAAHPSLREDHTFKVFLEFADEVHAYIHCICTYKSLHLK